MFGWLLDGWEKIMQAPLRGLLGFSERGCSQKLGEDWVFGCSHISTFITAQ